MRDLHEHRGRAALEQRLGGRHLPLESKYLSNLIGVNLQIEHLGAYHALRETRLVRVLVHSACSNARRLLHDHLSGKRAPCARLLERDRVRHLLQVLGQRAVRARAHALGVIVDDVHHATD